MDVMADARKPQARKREAGPVKVARDVGAVRQGARGNVVQQMLGTRRRVDSEESLESPSSLLKLRTRDVF